MWRQGGAKVEVKSTCARELVAVVHPKSLKSELKFFQEEEGKRITTRDEMQRFPEPQSCSVISQLLKAD